jgi:hypothetical protein
VPGRASRIASCAAIAGIGGATFGFGINHLVQRSDQIRSPAAVMQASGTYQQEVCIFNAIRSDVPEGAAVYVSSSDVSHTQRLAELSTLWAVPKEQRAAAQWVLTINYLGKYGPPRHRRGVIFTICGGAILMAQHI